jgi:hypothetical protein
MTKTVTPTARLVLPMTDTPNSPSSAALTAEPLTMHRDDEKFLRKHAEREAWPAIDDVGVDAFANAMKRKLAQKRREGRSGWDREEQCSIESLEQLLRDHLAKGDPVDIGNFAMMIYNRRLWSTVEHPDEAGKCCACGLPVYHRRGSPGEYDHECAVAAVRPAPEVSHD